MDKKTAALVDIIFARHTNALAAAADGECVPLGTVRFSLHLALAELADWMCDWHSRLPPEMPAALAPQQTPGSAPRLMTAEEADAAAEDAEDAPGNRTPAQPQPAAQRSKPGPKPGYKRTGRPERPERPSADDIAQQLEQEAEKAHVRQLGKAPIGLNAGHIAANPDGDQVLTGRLKREETVTRRVNGVPQQFTRQYIELR